MKVIQSVSEFREFRKTVLEPVGFVPTMGGLHEGHLSLIKESLKTTPLTVVSLFLNPTQFNNSKDLETYPSDLQSDLRQLEALGVDVVFTPNPTEMYPDDFTYKVTESKESLDLCGEYRPGHFDGVLTVVMKLFHLVQPEKAFFGEKDFQQLALIKGMVEAFFMNVEIVPLPTIREPSGLAMSSRNERLSAEGRQKAALLYEVLKKTESSEKMKSDLESEGFQVDYLVDKWDRRFVAATLEGVRLIDNVPKKDLTI